MKTKKAKVHPVLLKISFICKRHGHFLAPYHDHCVLCNRPLTDMVEKHEQWQRIPNRYYPAIEPKQIPPDKPWSPEEQKPEGMSAMEWALRKRKLV